MLKAVKEFMQSAFGQGTEATSSVDHEHALRIATAALLVEMSRADHGQGDREREAIVHILRDDFALDAAEARELLDTASGEADSAVSLHEFTRLLHAHLSQDDKRRVIEMLWEVAYTDGRLDKYEEHLVRKVADLLYVPHGEFIRLKHRVSERQR